MDYELCKKLKDAGFPKEMQESQLTDGEVYFRLPPTLSQLIEACGTPFMLQTHDGKIWQAYHDTHTITIDEVGDGSTPEEAVANLWLALQDKE